MTAEQRAAIEAVRARQAIPEARAELDRARQQVREEIPPASADAPLVEMLQSLRAERERLGLSLADVSERTGMDRATLSKLETGKVANPTYFTLRTYARALGRRIAWGLESIDAPNGIAAPPNGHATPST